MRARLPVVALVALSLASGCSASKPAARIPVTLAQGSSRLHIRAEIASTPADRGEGLMGRRSLAGNVGMLFVFPGQVQVGFYMKDTLIPLDIAFISRGFVVEVDTMTPCKANPCPVTTPAFGYEQALEVKAGTFGPAGISAGAAVSFGGAIPKGS